jgi:hypothetical protein
LEVIGGQLFLLPTQMTTAIGLFRADRLPRLIEEGKTDLEQSSIIGREWAQMDAETQQVYLDRALGLNPPSSGSQYFPMPTVSSNPSEHPTRKFNFRPTPGSPVPSKPSRKHGHKGRTRYTEFHDSLIGIMQNLLPDIAPNEIEASIKKLYTAVPRSRKITTVK